MKRRTLLAVCSSLAISGCTLRGDSDDERPPPVDVPSPTTWSTYRGTVGQTGRAATELKPPFDVDLIRELDRRLAVGDPPIPAPTAGLVVTHDTVYATARDGHFPPIAVSRTGHDVRWRFDEIVEQPHEEAFYRTPVPVVIGDDVFVQTHWDLYRIDGQNGDLVWSEGGTMTRNGPMVGDRSRLYYPDSVGLVDARSGEYAGPHRFRDRGVFTGLSIGDAGAVAVARTNDGHDGVIAGYDTDDWSVQWQDDTAHPFFEAPAIHEGVAIALADGSGGPIRGAGGNTIAYDLATGTVLWRVDTPQARGGVGLHEGGTAYLPHETDGVLALDVEDGTRKWHADRSLSSLVGDPHDCYPPIVADDAVVLSGRGGLAILDRDDGTLRHHLDRPLLGMPAAAYGDVYAITDEEILAIRGSS
jgi:outer membrane protein assembly factor BamB